MKKIFQLLIPILFGAIFSVSCVSKKEVLYFQDIERLDSIANNNTYQTVIRPDDLLTITVSAIDPEIVAPFNLPLVSAPTQDGSIRASQSLQTYLVDKNGVVNFPVIGEIALGGLTREEAQTKLTEEITDYVNDPIINLRILNFTISVLGEVQRPGTYTVNDERITVLEALGLAGDMTIFGKRKEVIVIRENKGKKEYGLLDFTSAELVNSPFYYLQQNDVVIVSPNDAQVQSSGFNRNASIFISIAGIIISVIAVLTR